MNQLKHIKGVVFDWAGTIVDYGCLAPTQVFIDVFRERNILVSAAEARGPMGLAKKDHVREIIRLDSIQKQWIAEFGRLPEELDINELYEELEPTLAAIVRNHSAPIPGAVELFTRLKEQGIKIGSTTGYVDEMMQNIYPVSSKFGLIPDSVITSSDVPCGRPAPWMIFRNCEKLNVFPLNQMVKIGDTVADIQEGINAGMWTIGLTKSGNELGLSEADAANANPVWLADKLEQAAQKLFKAGADFVVEGVWDCWPILEEIDRRIEAKLKSNDQRH